MKKLLLLLIVAGVVLGGAAYGWHLWREHQNERVAYTFAAVEKGTLDETVSTNGLVQPRDVLIVGSEMPGKVVAVLADYNQTVREGDVLLRLDDRLARTQLEKAETAVKLARVAVKQAEATRDMANSAYKHLDKMPSEVRSKTEVEIARDKLRAAEVGIEAANVKVQEAEDARRQAELGLRLLTVRVPYLQTDSALNRPGTGVVSEQAASSRSKRSFVVLERKVSVNQEIGSSLQGHLFTLASDLHRMRVKALVGEGDIDKVRRGMGVRFSVSGGGEDARKFTGTVEDIYLMPRQEHGAVSFEVLIDVRNEPISDGEDWKLRPGLTASVDIIRRTHRGVWKVPTAALNFEPRADHITPDAHAKLDRRNDLREPSQWQTVWTVDDKGKPWPLFVRTGGKGAHGETGIQDDQSTEVLEWESDVKEPASLRVITAEPPPPKPLFSVPNIKF